MQELQMVCYEAASALKMKEALGVDILRLEGGVLYITVTKHFIATEAVGIEELYTIPALIRKQILYRCHMREGHAQDKVRQRKRLDCPIGGLTLHKIASLHGHLCHNTVTGLNAHVFGTEGVNNDIGNAGILQHAAQYRLCCSTATDVTGTDKSDSLSLHK